MKNVKYAVIILNYNTISDAISAAKSVIEYSTTDSYVICIADNASSKFEDREELKTINLKNTITCQFKKNNGYASGNNKAIEKVMESYIPEYMLIMNPDVLLLEQGTIEGMISIIQKQDKRIVGGQPLVWNCYYGDDATVQQNIRRVPDYKELCVIRFNPFKVVFGKRYSRFIYADEMPYKKHIQYYVPSGAFFIIRTDVFKELGFFDANTFLYYEEHILGYKLREAGKKMLFMPEYKVRHEHGKSTGHNKYLFNKNAYKIGLDSCLYYAETYLKINKGQKGLLIFLHFLNGIIMQMVSCITHIKKRNIR